MNADANVVLPERDTYFRELSAVSWPALLIFLLALSTGIATTGAGNG
jgi:hypothetical protein